VFRSTFLGHQLLEVFLEFNRELPVVLGGGGLVKRITVPKVSALEAKCKRSPTSAGAMA
jgi:hypothetical protein